MALTADQYLTLTIVKVGLEKWKSGDLISMSDQWALMRQLEIVGKWMISGSIQEEVTQSLFELHDLKDFTVGFLQRLMEEVEKQQQ